MYRVGVSLNEQCSIDKTVDFSEVPGIETGKMMFVRNERLVMWNNSTGFERWKFKKVTVLLIKHVYYETHSLLKFSLNPHFCTIFLNFWIKVASFSALLKSCTPCLYSYSPLIAWKHLYSRTYHGYKIIYFHPHNPNCGRINLLSITSNFAVWTPQKQFIGFN